MTCVLPLCKAIAQLNKDEEAGVTPDDEQYGVSWNQYLSAGGDRGMLNDLPCDCEHEHFVRRRR